VIDTAILLALALLVRVTLLGRWPDVVTGDEGLVGLVARGLARGGRRRARAQLHRHA